MICRAILEIKSDAKVTVQGSDIDTCTITWHDNNPTNITKTQIKEKMNELPTDEELIIEKENSKVSAKTKLMNGEALTEDEANVMVGL